MPHEQDNTRKDLWHAGDRVALVSCTDSWTHIPPGTLGTVKFVDDAGTVFVDWDSGPYLGMIPGEDVIQAAS